MKKVQMGEIVKFVSKSERERVRLIREARAIYDSIFPSAGAAYGQQPSLDASSDVKSSHVASGHAELPSRKR